MTTTMTKQTAGTLPPPFDPSDHKPYELMNYQDRLNIWRVYGYYKQASTQTRVITDAAASRFVADQLSIIRDNYIRKFSADDLTDPRYL